MIELPIKHPELFDALGVAQPKGVLLYGPPGTGKTLLARAVAHHTDCTFIRVSGSELVQKYIGEGSRMVRELFVMARCAAGAGCCGMMHGLEPGLALSCRQRDGRRRAGGLLRRRRHGGSCMQFDGSRMHAPAGLLCEATQLSVRHDAILTGDRAEAPPSSCTFQGLQESMSTHYT